MTLFYRAADYRDDCCTTCDCGAKFCRDQHPSPLDLCPNCTDTAHIRNEVWEDRTDEWWNE